MLVVISFLSKISIYNFIDTFISFLYEIYEKMECLRHLSADGNFKNQQVSSLPALTAYDVAQLIVT